MARTKKKKRRNPAADIVAKLGGLDGVEKLTGAGRNSIHNWIACEQFPARYYKCMRDALAMRGHRAPHALWGQRDKSSSVEAA